MGDARLERLAVAEDIREARTLPAEVYADPALFDLIRERVFGQSWQFVADARDLSVPGQVLPVALLEGCLDRGRYSPTREQGRQHFHRLLVERLRG